MIPVLILIGAGILTLGVIVGAIYYCAGHMDAEFTDNSGGTK